MLVVMVTAAVRVVVISKKLFNCIFCGGIRCIGSCSGVNRGCGGSSIAHHFHTYHYHYHYNHHHNHHHHNQPRALPHTIHLTMALLMRVKLVTLLGCDGGGGDGKGF